MAALENGTFKHLHLCFPTLLRPDSQGHDLNCGVACVDRGCVVDRECVINITVD